MATLSGSATRQAAAGPEYVAEGLAFGLHAVLVLSVVSAMNRVDLGDRVGVLGPLALMGLVLGYLLSQTRAQDLVAHSVALWTGAMAAVLLVTLETAGPVEIVRSKGAVFVDLVTG